mgnify:CR=1 FL=1
MSEDRIPAEIFHPSEFIIEEMAARGWTSLDLSSMAVMPLTELQGILAGGPLLAHHAERLAVAFGTSPQLWANLWMAYKKYAAMRER